MKKLLLLLISVSLTYASQEKPKQPAQPKSILQKNISSTETKEIAEKDTTTNDDKKIANNQETCTKQLKPKKMVSFAPKKLVYLIKKLTPKEKAAKKLWLRNQINHAQELVRMEKQLKPYYQRAYGKELDSDFYAMTDDNAIKTTTISDIENSFNIIEKRIYLIETLKKTNHHTIDNKYYIDLYNEMIKNYNNTLDSFLTFKNSQRSKGDKDKKSNSESIEFISDHEFTLDQSLKCSKELLKYVLDPITYAPSFPDVYNPQVENAVSKEDYDAFAKSLDSMCGYSNEQDEQTATDESKTTKETA